MKSKNVYSLPFKENAVFLPVSYAHTGSMKHAIDFTVNFGIPVLAAMDGEIVKVKDASTEGGDDEKYAADKYNNYIIIKHANSEFTEYYHLAHRSVLVKKGDRVKKGKPIAKGVGMTGYTTAPHLHFMVYVKKNAGLDSREIKFDKKIKIIRAWKEELKELKRPKFRRLRKMLAKYQEI